MSSIQQEVQNLGTPGGACPRCAEHNLYTNLVCTACGTRLPWADAVTHGATNVHTATHAPLSIATSKVTVNHGSKPNVVDDVRDALGPKAPLAVLAVLIAGALMGMALVGPFILHSEPAGVRAPASQNAPFSSAPPKQAPPTATHTPEDTALSSPVVIQPHSVNRAPVVAPLLSSGSLQKQVERQRPVISENAVERRNGPATASSPATQPFPVSQLRTVKQARVISFQNIIDGFADDIRAASTQAHLYEIRGHIRDLVHDVAAGMIQANSSTDAERIRDNDDLLYALGVLQKAVDNKLDDNSVAMEQCLNAAQYRMRRMTPQARGQEQVRFEHHMDELIRSDTATR